MSNQATSEPSKGEAIELFKDVEKKFPSATLGDDKWYILVLAALTSSPYPTLAPALYTYLINRPDFDTTEKKQALMRRMRETLFKLVIIVGVVKPLEVVFGIEEVAGDGKDYTFSREGWQCDEANRKRGWAWQSRLYAQNQGKIDDVLSSQKDFDWLTREITYGLFLSDHSTLNDVETEITVLTGIMMQNLPREAAWHLRGTRRIGVSSEDVEGIQQCIEIVARFCGVVLDRVPRAKDIEHEV